MKTFSLSLVVLSTLATAALSQRCTNTSVHGKKPLGRGAGGAHTSVHVHGKKPMGGGDAHASVHGKKPLGVGCSLA